MDSRLIEQLQKNGIQFKEFKHAPVFTVEESKTLKREIPGMHCKCLFLKDDQGRFYLVGMPAEKRLDSKAFRKEVGAKKVRFGSAEELRDKTSLVPGSVSIFGMVNADERVELILDEEAWEADEVGFHPNENTSTIVLKHEDLKKYIDSLDRRKRIMRL